MPHTSIPSPNPPAWRALHCFATSCPDQQGRCKQDKQNISPTAHDKAKHKHCIDNITYTLHKGRNDTHCVTRAGGRAVWHQFSSHAPQTQSPRLRTLCTILRSFAPANTMTPSTAPHNSRSGGTGRSWSGSRHGPRHRPRGGTAREQRRSHRRPSRLVGNTQPPYTLYMSRLTTDRCANGLATL